ncbi:hypothetical protein F4679DRAFT_522928 [Xylaria curta]|nr:hypothetical protein F4679DRAFT_522928 [Xylaria curta]
MPAYILFLDVFVDFWLATGRNWGLGRRRGLGGVGRASTHPYLYRICLPTYLPLNPPPQRPSEQWERNGRPGR